jgi:DNA polymerase V
MSTSNSLELVKKSICALNKVYKYGYFYQKAGIILSKLEDADKNELNLLSPLMENKSKTLMKAIDFTNAKYGRNSISVAQVGIDKSWKMKREHFSKIDTAKFESLPTLKI